MSVEANRPPLHLERPGHDSQGKRSRLEHRSLFDVQFDVAIRVRKARSRLVHAVHIHTMSRQCLDRACAVRIAQTPHDLEVEDTGRRSRAHKAEPETGALLVSPVHKGDGDRRLRSGRHSAEYLEGGKHAKTTIKPAAVRNRVDVTSDDQLPRRRALQRRPQVPRGVGLGPNGKFREPGRQDCRARAQISVHATRCAPRSVAVSAPSERRPLRSSVLEAGTCTPAVAPHAAPPAVWCRRSDGRRSMSCSCSAYRAALNLTAAECAHDHGFSTFASAAPQSFVYESTYG